VQQLINFYKPDHARKFGKIPEMGNFNPTKLITIG
jgi:hypothetical protein